MLITFDSSIALGYFYYFTPRLTHTALNINCGFNAFHLRFHYKVFWIHKLWSLWAKIHQNVVVLTSIGVNILKSWATLLWNASYRGHNKNDNGLYKSNKERFVIIPVLLCPIVYKLYILSVKSYLCKLSIFFQLYQRNMNELQLPN